jgi:Permease MlaE
VRRSKRNQTLRQRNALIGKPLLSARRGLHSHSSSGGAALTLPNRDQMSYSARPGRVGSAFAAELGTMQVSEQVDSLRVLATDPVDYLVSPRVVACMIAGPVLNVLCFCMGAPPVRLPACLPAIWLPRPACQRLCGARRFHARRVAKAFCLSSSFCCPQAMLFQRVIDASARHQPLPFFVLHPLTPRSGGDRSACSSDVRRRHQ